MSRCTTGLLGDMSSWLLVGLAALRVVGASAPTGPWDSFNYAPKSRTVFPTSITKTTGTVRNARGLVSTGSATLFGNGSWVALDFGIEVCTLGFLISSRKLKMGKDM